MSRINAVLFAAVIIATFMQCHRPPVPPPPTDSTPDTAIGDNSRNSLDWPGTYLGSIPDPDGNITETGLHLREDGTYRLETATGSGEAEVHSGRFAWEADGGSIKLLDIDSTSRPIYYRVGENHLRQLDLVNRTIEGKLDDTYSLAKDTVGLRGTTWRLRSLEGQPVDLGKRQPTLVFTALGSALTGNAGCNGYRSEYSLAAEHNIDIPMPVATKMACPELATERAFFQALMGASTYEFAGEMLVLRDAAGADVATFTARGGAGAQEK